MNITEYEALQFLEDNDVKFVRLAYFDIFGKMKNISIISSELKRAFESGILFEASCIKGFRDVEEYDLLLFPDPDTMTVLPWRPQRGKVVRFYCNIKYADGTPYECDSRYILKNALLKAQEEGYTVQIGTECEFYLFELDEKGRPTKIPFDNGGYCDVAPLDKGENVRREICLALEEMGIQPETSYHESGPGQNEIDFQYSNALYAADNLQTFKSVVKSIANINGLYSSFMPLPLKEHCGSGLHINLSLLSNGINIFKQDSDTDNHIADSFIAGILNRINEITVFSNPIINSYSRLGKGEAPKYISWSHQNRSQLIRVPSQRGDLSRMELRSPDPACNPYIVFALLISAGLEGIKNHLELPQPVDRNLYEVLEQETQGIGTLPESLEKAIEYAKSSSFIKENLNDRILNSFITEKESECINYQKAIDKNNFEFVEYFLNY